MEHASQLDFLSNRCIATTSQQATKPGRTCRTYTQICRSNTQLVVTGVHGPAHFKGSCILTSKGMVTSCMGGSFFSSIYRELNVASSSYVANCPWLDTMPLDGQPELHALSPETCYSHQGGLRRIGRV